MDFKPIILNEKELKDIKENNKVIGSGSDGTLYYVGNGELYKIYHSFSDYISPIIYGGKIIDGDIKEFNKKNFRTNNRSFDNRVIRYEDIDGVKLTRNDALIKTMERRAYVKGTRLPKNIIYLNDKVIGCVQDYFPNTKSIYTVDKFINYKNKLIVMKRLLEKVKELFDNNVYPVDLCQRNPINIYDKSYSNILIKKLEPIIIDIDGKSAIYTERFSDEYMKKSSFTFAILVIEILNKVDIQEGLREEDLDSVFNILNKLGYDNNFINKFIERNINIDDVENIINTNLHR